MNLRVNFNTEPCDVYVGRPSRWSNPFPIGVYGDRYEVLDLFEQYVYARPDLIEAICRELKAKVLGCHCSHTMPCHADFLARIANGHQMAYELRNSDDTSY